LGSNQLAVKLQERNEALREKLLQGGGGGGGGISHRTKAASQDLSSCTQENKKLEELFTQGRQSCLAKIKGLRAAESKLQQQLGLQKKVATAAQTKRGESYTKLTKEKDKADGLLKGEKMRTLNLKDKIKVLKDSVNRVSSMKLKLDAMKTRNSILRTEVKTLRGAHESKEEPKVANTKYTIQMQKLKSLEALKTSEKDGMAEMEAVFKKHATQTKSLNGKLAAQSGEIEMLRLGMKLAKQANTKHHQVASARLRSLEKKDAQIRDMASKLAKAQIAEKNLEQLKTISDRTIAQQKDFATKMKLRLKLAREEAGIHDSKGEKLLQRTKGLKVTLMSQTLQQKKLRSDLKTASSSGGKYSGKATQLNRQLKLQNRRVEMLTEHVALLNERMAHRKANEALVKREKNLVLKSKKGAIVNTLLQAAKKKQKKIMDLETEMAFNSKTADSKLALVYQQHETTQAKLRRTLPSQRGRLRWPRKLGS